MKIIGYITLTVFNVFLAWLLSGWAIALLWSWFVLPVFFLPPLTWAQAAGLGMVIGYLTHQIDLKKDERPYVEKLVASISFAITKPLICVGFGWVLKHFLP